MNLAYLLITELSKEVQRPLPLAHFLQVRNLRRRGTLSFPAMNTGTRTRCGSRSAHSPLRRYIHSPVRTNNG